jgi:hypothetical protein
VHAGAYPCAANALNQRNASGHKTLVPLPWEQWLLCCAGHTDNSTIGTFFETRCLEIWVSFTLEVASFEVVDVQSNQRRVITKQLDCC